VLELKSIYQFLKPQIVVRAAKHRFRIFTSYTPNYVWCLYIEFVTVPCLLLCNQGYLLYPQCKLQFSVIRQQAWVFETYWDGSACERVRLAWQWWRWKTL